MTRLAVTLVTPSYNQAAYVRATIESVLAQDYPDLEYIVMDGGSTDGTAAIAAEYAGRLTWISEKDRGQAHAINKGFQRARGQVVAWINSDDILLPGAVSAAVRAFEETPEVGAIYGEGYCIDGAGCVTMRFPFIEPFNLWKLHFLCDYILQQATFFRRSAVEEVGWLDESLCWALDWDILVRLGDRFGLRHIPVDMGCLREYRETKTASGGPRRFQELRQVLQKQTGSIWPPGCWYYGLDTYDKIWSGQLREAGVGPFKPVAQWAAGNLYNLCRYKIDRTALHSQGYYHGGWAARRMHWMVPRGSGGFIVRGEIPPWYGGKPLHLSVSIEGQPVARRPLPEGLFEWEISAPQCGTGGATLLRFDASQDSRAAPGSMAPEGQRLSWRVISIARSA